jgi:hypothetical protein
MCFFVPFVLIDASINQTGKIFQKKNDAVLDDFDFKFVITSFTIVLLHDLWIKTATNLHKFTRISSQNKN